MKLLQLNDCHGYLESHQEIFWKSKKPMHRQLGGFSRIKTIFEQIENESKGSYLALDCGDTLHGTYSVVKSHGKAMIPLLNDLKLGAMTAHWEFAYGPKKFLEITKKLKHPMLAINCYQKKNNKLLFPPYTILNIGDLQVGIIGIAATIVDKVMPPHFSEGIYFTLGNEELPTYIQKLKFEENVDLIVLISHLGFPQEVKLAGEVEGLDVILSSHTHNRLYHPVLVNKTIIIQSGCHGSFVGLLELEIKNKKIKNYDHKLISVEQDITPHDEMEDKIEAIMAPHRSYLQDKVGETKTALNRSTILESTMDNFLLQSIMYVKEADVAFSNGWRYGAPIPPGEITMQDLWNIIPVNPPVSTVDLTGKEIWHMLEHNLELTFSRNPYNQMGGYLKRCRNLNMYFKIENPPGERVQEIFINGKSINPSQTYKAVFVTSQGVSPLYGINRQEHPINAIDALKKYLEINNRIEAPLENSMVAV